LGHWGNIGGLEYWGHIADWDIRGILQIGTLGEYRGIEILDEYC